MSATTQATKEFVVSVSIDLLVKGPEGNLLVPVVEPERVRTFEDGAAAKQFAISLMTSPKADKRDEKFTSMVEDARCGKPRSVPRLSRLEVAHAPIADLSEKVTVARNAVQKAYSTNAGNQPLIDLALWDILELLNKAEQRIIQLEVAVRPGD